MDKANVIKALELCGRAEGCDNCMDCPYREMPFCDSAMCNDAIALLKANSEAPKSKYTMVYIYTKKGNLLPYITGKMMRTVHTPEESKRLCDYYAKEREIQLIALFRWKNGKVFCKIKCPINPLPVKGEFEVPSTGVLADFLVKEGWSFKQKIYPHMFE